jgi:hypothetical protein
MTDPTLSELMADLARYRPMLEAMYQNWVKQQAAGALREPQDAEPPPAPSIHITLTQTGDQR